jgi:hypothetical protein
MVVPIMRSFPGRHAAPEFFKPVLRHHDLRQRRGFFALLEWHRFVHQTYGPKTLLYECGLRRDERLSVLSDDTDFFSVDARELHGFSEECVFFVLVVRRERVLMNDDQVGAVTAGAGKVR